MKQMNLENEKGKLFTRKVTSDVTLLKSQITLIAKVCLNYFIDSLRSTLYSNLYLQYEVFAITTLKLSYTLMKLILSVGGASRRGF